MLTTTNEVLDAVKEYFSRPGAVLAANMDAEDGEVRCVYRGDNDPASPVRCAIGCLIPDELYNPDWEGYSACAVLPTLVENGVIAADLATGGHCYFFDMLQAAHDDLVTEGQGVERFLERLEMLREEHGA